MDVQAVKSGHGGFPVPWMATFFNPLFSLESLLFYLWFNGPDDEAIVDDVDVQEKPKPQPPEDMAA